MVQKARRYVQDKATNKNNINERTTNHTRKNAVGMMELERKTYDVAKCIKNPRKH